MITIEPNNKNLSLYNNMPIIIQNFLCSLKGLQLKLTRFDWHFKKTLKEFNKRKNYNEKEIIEYQNKRISWIVEYAYKNTPYYTQLFDKLKIDYTTINSLEDLKKIPILNKDDILENYNLFLPSKRIQKKCYKAHTSGTTGSGLNFYTTKESVHAQWASFWRFWNSIGINNHEWCAVFGNKMIVPYKQNKPPFWRISFPTHQIYFSGYHESDDNLYYYYEYIKKKKIRWIHGYPSLITAFAEYIVSNDLIIDTVKWVTTSAETLLPNQKAIIEKAFMVDVKQVYGQTEEVAIFHENENKEIVIDEDFSAVEFIKQDTDNYLVIGTNLYNYALPFIRYNTKDTVTLKDIKKRIIESIDGRIEDYIYLPNGRKIGKLYNIFEDTLGFKEVQLHQNSDYSITIYVVKRYNDVEKDEKKSTKLLKLALGNDIPFEYKYVDQITRTKSNKLRFIVSDIARH